MVASERDLASSRAGHQRQKALSASLERGSTGVPDLASPVNLSFSLFLVLIILAFPTLSQPTSPQIRDINGNLFPGEPHFGVKQCLWPGKGERGRQNKVGLRFSILISKSDKLTVPRKKK